MPNMSNKNFPHAHGSGRVIAAFSLAHPGGTAPGFGASYLPGASEMLAKPPAFVDDTLPTTYPYPEFSLPAPGTASWTPNRQPYNATSLGVYVTGSGTRRLPYRDALGLFAPGGLSPELEAAWPDNKVYPFALIDETKVGSSHGQVVCSVTGELGEEVLGQIAYYEVGLNWELPPLTMRFAYNAFVVSNAVSNFPNQAIASFQRALERTFWVTASLSGNALSERHPDIPGPPIPGTVNLSGGPIAGATAGIGTGGGVTRGYAAPYSALAAAPVEPSNFGGSFWSVAEDEGFSQRPAIIQTQLSAIWENYAAAFDLSDPANPIIEIRIKAAPIVRIWCSVPVEPTDPGNSPMVSPRPLPRAGLNPYESDPLEVGKLPPAINVQVTQKNTAAIDGTDNGIYDMSGNWGRWGEASLLATQRSSAPASIEGTAIEPLVKAKKEDR